MISRTCTLFCELVFWKRYLGLESSRELTDVKPVSFFPALLFSIHAKRAYQTIEIPILSVSWFSAMLRLSGTSYFGSWGLQRHDIIVSKDTGKQGFSFESSPYDKIIHILIGLKKTMAYLQEISLISPNTWFIYIFFCRNLRYKL